MKNSVVLDIAGFKGLRYCVASRSISRPPQTLYGVKGLRWIPFRCEFLSPSFVVNVSIYSVRYTCMYVSFLPPSLANSCGILPECAHLFRYRQRVHALPIVVKSRCLYCFFLPKLTQIIHLVLCVERYYCCDFASILSDFCCCAFLLLYILFECFAAQVVFVAQAGTFRRRLCYCLKIPVPFNIGV